MKRRPEKHPEYNSTPSGIEINALKFFQARNQLKKMQNGAKIYFNLILSGTKKL